ncbi:porin [Pontibacter qinzhouensis]|uniref:Porin n=1 Tax=Pontibacter qinzhouensis TaxID=2603253 RepID=A0A5C8K9M8_9BACT|nr:porin [Pontibacter qinzhouensis]TXK45850.1 porin [Pontibacter qinzhouensis]
MRIRFILLAMLATGFSWGTASAQKHHEAHEPDTVQVKSVQELFTKGTVHGHVRNYFMATWNHHQLSDNYANAIGAEIAFKTATFHGFRMGFAGLFTYNLFSSGMTHRDHVTGKYPKLELELFDVEDPQNKADLDRLDELYLEYKAGWLHAKAGRFSFTSPLMNPQDTRMKPYSFQGINLKFPIQDKALLTLAWFDHFSPRSTVEWFKAGESIGIFPTGVDMQGNRSGHAHHTETRGVAVTGLQVNTGFAKHSITAEVWNYWIENVSNTSYGRATIEIAPRVKAGLEGLYQEQAGNGGDQEEALAYFPDQQQWLVGSQLAYEPGSWSMSFNYLHIDGNGRFLFPREWGREQFFATLSRGRMEGTGRSDLLVAKVKRRWSDRLSVEVAASKAWMPALGNYRHNKYGAVPYIGWLVDISYSPVKPILKGLNFRLLYVGKTSPGTDLPLEAMYYNTNFHNLNFVTQLNF